MNITNYRRVRVRDEMGKVVLNWWRLFFGSLTVETVHGRTVITKQGLWGKRTYIPSECQSVEMRLW